MIKTRTKPRLNLVKISSKTKQGLDQVETGSKPGLKLD